MTAPTSAGAAAALPLRRFTWRGDASLPTVTWQHWAHATDLAFTLCHPDGRIREAALDQTEERPALIALVIIRCADWAEPVRERPRVLLSDTPPHLPAAHAALTLRIGRRPRGGFAQDLLTGALPAGPAAQAEELLDSGDPATARLAYHIVVERRLLPAARFAQIAARHRDVVVQDRYAEAAVATLTEGHGYRGTGESWERRAVVGCGEITMQRRRRAPVAQRVRAAHRSEVGPPLTSGHPDPPLHRLRGRRGVARDATVAQQHAPAQDITGSCRGVPRGAQR
ncbi:hypothetical protein [Streptomyces fagopyri]|uniref:hypothetical protein n=1 Tax=Streptomyces fagopyri TaxID=2662397 RepID=UPI00381169E9